jgi:hypothetical protein
VTPIWVHELAAYFWGKAGTPPAFPRDLGSAAATGFPLSVVALPGLTLDAVRGRLARSGIPCRADEPDRPLRGCLVSRGGAGFVFVDASDPPAERRFSVAHEVAHFLRDYDAVRRAAARRVGPAAVEVLDGLRPATAGERVRAVFAAVPVTAHVHLLRRDDGGRPRSTVEREAEAAADRLAFELLAPAALLRGSEGIAARLEAEFGLPPAAAAAYAAILYPPAPPTDRFIARLRL